MIEIERNEVPYAEDDARATFLDGVCVRYDEGRRYTSLFIGHETRTETDEDGNETAKVYAFQIRVRKPLTRAKAISAAEAAAYNLRTAEDIASFGTSLARKARLGEDTDEVTEHDSFITWVKEQLTAIGVV